jgi:hypothetical protein
VVDVPPELIGAAGGGLILRKLFGGALDEVGETLRRWTEYKLRNVGRVVENAGTKLGDELGEAEVPPRVGIRVLEESWYADEDVLVDYLGGVLASAWTPQGRDDRGAAFAALIARLSSYQLRSHYIWYTALRRALAGIEINLRDAGERQRLARIYMPSASYFVAMAFSEGEDYEAIFSHCFHGLNDEGLAYGEAAGPYEHLANSIFGAGVPPRARNAPVANGIVLGPTVRGVELYLWAHGKGTADIQTFLDPAEDWRFGAEVNVPDEAQLVTDMRTALLASTAEPSDLQPDSPGGASGEDAPSQ